MNINIKNNISDINIGERIKKYRNQNQLTVKDIRTLMMNYGQSISEKSIYKWENGSITPSLSSIIILCEIFNVTPSDFLKVGTNKKQNVTRQELKFLHTLRSDKMYRKLIIMLYKKEVEKNDKNRTTIKNSEKAQ